MKLRCLFLVAVLASSLPAFSSVDQYGDFRIESIRFSASGTYIRFNPAPAVCEGGDSYRMHAMIPNTNANADKMVSALLAAYAADLRFRYLWFSDVGEPCSTSHILTLDMFELKYK